VDLPPPVAIRAPVGEVSAALARERSRPLVLVPTAEKLHDPVVDPVLVADVIERADVGVIEKRMARASRSKRCLASGLEDRWVGKILIATVRSRRVSRAR
jgi:hypothetical protein